MGEEIIKDITSCSRIMNEFSSFHDRILRLNGQLISPSVSIEITKQDQYWINCNDAIVSKDILYSDKQNTLETDNGFSFIFSSFSSTRVAGEKAMISTIVADEVKYGNCDLCYYRAILPIKHLNPFSFELYDSKCYTQINEQRRNIILFSFITCTIANEAFDIFKDEGFIIIESKVKLGYEVFKTKVDYLLECIGFFSGVFIHDECFCFSCDDSSFSRIIGIRYKKLSGSIQTDLTLISQERELNEVIFPNRKADGFCSFIKQSVFDEMLNRLCEKETGRKLENLLFVLMYSSTYSLDTRSICLSAAVEGMRRYLEATNAKITKSHIIDKTNTDECKRFINALRSDFEGKIIDSYVNKCFRLNKPNDELLFEPFSLFEVSIDEKDKDAIKARNTFLHGAMPSFDKVENKTIEVEAKKLSALSIRQFSMCYILLLKIIGYEGYIMNYRKLADFMESSTTNDADCMITI